MYPLLLLRSSVYVLLRICTRESGNWKKNVVGSGSFFFCCCRCCCSMQVTYQLLSFRSRSRGAIQMQQTQFSIFNIFPFQLTASFPVLLIDFFSSFFSLSTSQLFFFIFLLYEYSQCVYYHQVSWTFQWSEVRWSGNFFIFTVWAV